MNALASLARCAMRVLSARIEPPVRRDDGSTASTATLRPWPVSMWPSVSISVDLPTPGAPVMPTRTALPVSANSAWVSAAAVWRWSARLLSTSVMARDSTVRSPLRTSRASRSTSGSGGSEAMRCHRRNELAAQVLVVQVLSGQVLVDEALADQVLEDEADRVLTSQFSELQPRRREENCPALE